MPMTSLGDLTSTFLLRGSQSRFKTDLTRLSNEMTTGLASDARRHLDGNTGPLAAVERALVEISASREVARATGLQLATTQASMGRMSDEVGTLLQTLLPIQEGTGTTSIGRAATAARNGFEAVVSALNTSVNGRFLFSGTATEVSPLRPAEDILTDLRALVATETDAAGVVAAIDGYFAPGGTFDTTDYLGASVDQAPVRITRDQSVDATFRATERRALLSSMAKAAVLDGGTLLPDGERVAVVSMASADLLGQQDRLTDHQAAVGAAQALTERTVTRLQAEDTAMQQTRLDLIGVDPFETATRLEATRTQLETVYALTARLSRLSLANYL